MQSAFDIDPRMKDAPLVFHERNANWTGYVNMSLSVNPMSQLVIVGLRVLLILLLWRPSACVGSDNRSTLISHLHALTEVRNETITAWISTLYYSEWKSSNATSPSSSSL